MVGASFAYSLMQRGLASELVLIDSDTARADGEAMGLSDGLPFVQPMRIRAGGYADLVDAEVVVSFLSIIALAQRVRRRWPARADCVGLHH